MPFLELQVNIIEEIEEMTIRNLNFKPEDWSLRDADILKLAANFIEQEIKRSKLKMKDQKKPC